jgi:hypothetical protein
MRGCTHRCTERGARVRAGHGCGQGCRAGRNRTRGKGGGACAAAGRACTYTPCLPCLLAHLTYSGPCMVRLRTNRTREYMAYGVYGSSNSMGDCVNQSIIPKDHTTKHAICQYTAHMHSTHTTHTAHTQHTHSTHTRAPHFHLHSTHTAHTAHTARTEDTTHSTYTAHSAPHLPSPQLGVGPAQRAQAGQHREEAPPAIAAAQPPREPLLDVPRELLRLRGSLRSVAHGATSVRKGYPRRATRMGTSAQTSSHRTAQGTGPGIAS